MNVGFSCLNGVYPKWDILEIYPRSWKMKRDAPKVKADAKKPWSRSPNRMLFDQEWMMGA